MAYETDDQQSAFFSHYTSTPKNENRHLLLDADFDCALLSHVCREIHGYIMPSTLVQDSVEYHNTFTGKYVVDCLRNILQANGKNDDRSRALILGRALLFQDVIQDIYGERKLRDADNHLYRFTQHYISTSSVTAVVTPLTSCYSPTCSIHQPCYSYNCPSKVSQTLKRSASQASLPDKENTRELWILSVPRDVIAATSPDERKRQECIYELIYTEEDYAKDLQYVHNHWIEPLLASDTIITPSERKERVVHQIFWNIIEIEMMSTALSMTLIQRRKEQDVVDTIGDVLLSFVSQFDPYVSYGSHQLVGKHYFELEKKRNPRFKQFVEETERKAESRRLELNGYLTKPTTRLGRYNLLLREILKRTPKGNPDRETLPKVMDIIARFLRYVNRETGNVENAFNLQQLEHRLTFKSSSIADLNLNDPKRTLVMKGRMKRKGNSSSDASDVQVLLFDHYLVFAKIKFQNHLEYYKVFRKV
ncbi:Dbl homology domain-containing protein [Syncephalastrum racemosum]|uniref:Dbl homology domain-containing protein n=1 Tax=Syncephalastrum racemosum TaxID=13706 RepID=A0A1X2HUB8_SYNRA|nr:Dbl homology domain-containing protein [Syncephalastrum racemosum]